MGQDGFSLICGRQGRKGTDGTRASPVRPQDPTNSLVPVVTPKQSYLAQKVVSSHHPVASAPADSRCLYFQKECREGQGTEAWEVGRGAAKAATTLASVLVGLREAPLAVVSPWGPHGPVSLGRISEGLTV